MLVRPCGTRSTRTVRDSGKRTMRNSMGDRRSELVEVLLDLEGRALAVEGPHLRALDGEVLADQHLAQRLAQDLVRLEGVERLAQRPGQPPDAALRSLGVGQAVRIDQGRGARMELPLDPVEAGGQEAAESQVGVAGGI